MNFDYTEKLVFWAEWFQAEANMARSFYISYFPADNTLEIFDHRTKKTFLKRTKVQGISEPSFYVGAKLNIFGRQIEILDYADTPTRSKLANTREKTFCMLKPSSIVSMDQILSRICNEGFSINNCAMLQLDSEEARRFYSDREGDAHLPFLIEHIVSGPILIMELISRNAVQRLIDVCGPEDPSDAKTHSPNSLRAKFGQDLLKNAVHCSQTAAAANRELKYFFSGDNTSFRTTAVLRHSTLAIVKPHAINEGKLGSICSAIYEDQFKITAMKLFYLERQNCEEFYEVYKGVVPEFVPMVLELANGPCVAMEIVACSPDINTHQEFRKLCGPSDPELAKQLRPHTIRARFGKTKVLNAIHCTDLAEDTNIEVEYFFKILK